MVKPQLMDLRNFLTGTFSSITWPIHEAVKRQHVRKRACHPLSRADQRWHGRNQLKVRQHDDRDACSGMCNIGWRKMISRENKSYPSPAEPFQRHMLR